MVSSSVTSSRQIGTNYLCTCFGTWTHEYGMGSWHQPASAAPWTNCLTSAILPSHSVRQQLCSSLGGQRRRANNGTFGDTYGDCTLMFRFDFRLNWSWIEFPIFPFLWSDGGGDVVRVVNAFEIPNWRCSGTCVIFQEINNSVILHWHDSEGTYLCRTTGRSVNWDWSLRC